MTIGNQKQVFGQVMPHSMSFILHRSNFFCLDPAIPKYAFRMSLGGGWIGVLALAALTVRSVAVCA
jgi:hypothetical protein